MLFVGSWTVGVNAASARTAALEFEVTFNANDSISVTLPDGTPVGTTSGAPTVIPAGFYTLNLNDSAVVSGPQFDLQGPGVNLVDNMFYGETASATDTADFAPSSTYTWRDDEHPSVVFTFTTSAVVAGGPSASGSAGPTAGGTPSSGSGPSQDVVGSEAPKPDPLRGPLVGTVSATGKLTLTRDGKNVATLKSGRYTITVTDRSAKSGFLIEEIRKTATTISGASFVGKRSVSVDLKAGQWFFFPTFVGKKTYFIVTSS
jgi:hypothetical protein